MPRGGKRVGAGRRRGTTRQTLARNAIKAAANTAHLDLAGDRPRRPALEVLQTLLDQALELVGYFEPKGGNAHADRSRHEYFFTLAKDLAKELAKYQAPQLRSVTVTPPMPLPEERVRRFTLNVFQNGRLIEPVTAPSIAPIDVTPANVKPLPPATIRSTNGFRYDDDDGDDAA